MKHEMRLNSEPYNCIKSGTKTIELRLNDDKRKKIKKDDIVEFTNRDTNEKMLVIVEDLFRYPSFEELYKHFDKVSLGYKENEDANYKDMESIILKKIRKNMEF